MCLNACASIVETFFHGLPERVGRRAVRQHHNVQRLRAASNARRKKRGRYACSYREL
jgi:hypothetical protein